MGIAQLLHGMSHDGVSHRGAYVKPSTKEVWHHLEEHSDLDHLPWASQCAEMFV